MANEKVVVVNRIGLGGLVVYLGTGFLFYALFGGTGGHFQIDSAWLYTWVLLWPLMLCITFFLWALIAIVVIGCVIGIVWLVGTSKWFQDWRHKRLVARIKRNTERRNASS